MTRKLFEDASALPESDTAADIALRSVADKVATLEIEDLAFDGFTCIACKNHYPGFESPLTQKSRYFILGTAHVKDHANERIRELKDTIERLRFERDEWGRKYRNLRDKNV